MNLKRVKHNLKAIVVIVLVLLLVTGCRTMKKNKEKDAYMGDYPELYSVAINSLLGSRGYSVSERRFNSQIKLIEEDEYGRVLFLFSEESPVGTYNLIISQTDNGEYAYFYPDYNFISISDEGIETLYFEDISEEHFPAEEIEILKEKNDWNKEIDVNQCMKVEIVRKKKQGTVKDETLKELYKKALGEDAYVHYKSYTSYSISDDYGRSIYLGMGLYSSRRFVVLLFDSDNSYDDESRGIMELEDWQNYQDDLKAFKELNNWNQPFPSE